MLLISCTSTHKKENPKISWPVFPDPILEDNSRVYKIPDTAKAKLNIYKEAEFVILPEDIWNQFYVWDEEIIIPKWYWINIASFVIDYEAAIDRLNIMEGKDE